jgi:hypothetical protein
VTNYLYGSKYPDRVSNPEFAVTFQRMQYSLQKVICVNYESEVCSLSQWSRCLRRNSAAILSLGLRVRIPQSAQMISCECCWLSRRGICDGPIPRPEESYRLYVCQWMWSGEGDFNNHGYINTREYNVAVTVAVHCIHRFALSSRTWIFRPAFLGDGHSQA